MLNVKDKNGRTAKLKFPTVEEMAQEVAMKALDEFEYEGKTIREWIDIIKNQPVLGTDLINRQAAIKDAESWVAVDEYKKHLQKNVVEWLKEFPSAVLGTNLAEVGDDREAVRGDHLPRCAPEKVERVHVPER